MRVRADLELHRPIYLGLQRGTTESTFGDAAAVAERKREERRRLIANNKAWDAAETVSGEWI